MKIHLTPLTKKKLFRTLGEQRTSNFTISNFKNGETLSDKAIAKAVKRIQERVAIPQWTPHDLRRTFATLIGEALHIDPVVVEKCPGHKMPKIMATYNRNEMLPKRKEALEKWSSFIENLIAA